jgi:hypothetical protein
VEEEMEVVEMIEVEEEEVEVTIRGRKYQVSREKVEDSLKDVLPQRISKYSVLVNGGSFPIKQVVAVALGLSPMEFGSSTAYQILQDLGFEICQGT